MLKTVAASLLRPGMFLHGLDRRWLDHPFWKNSFLLTAIDTREDCRKRNYVHCDRCGSRSVVLG
jgi:Na+-translocating ferredoxin:NAD+ oxidoreductase RnfC subunit